MHSFKNVALFIILILNIGLALMKSSHEIFKRGLISKKTKKWPGGVIPYDIDNKIFDINEINVISKAMAAWSEETCIKFKSYEPIDKNWIKITKKTSCYSEYSGMGPSGQQIVSFESPLCNFYGTYLHELGHVIGLEHEHQRDDRDKHIYVNIKSINKDELDQFKKIDRSDISSVSTPYDLQSIMHYGEYAFAEIPDSITMIAISKNLQKLLVSPAAKYLSFWDVKIVNEYYQCERICRKRVKCPHPGFIDKKCICQTPTSFNHRSCKNELKDSKCFELVKNYKCFNDAAYMILVCKKSCNYCYHPDPLNAGIMQNYLCEDFDSNCKSLKENNACQTHRLFMRFHCPKICGLCGQPFIKKKILI